VIYYYIKNQLVVKLVETVPGLVQTQKYSTLSHIINEKPVQRGSLHLPRVLNQIGKWPIPSSRTSRVGSDSAVGFNHFASIVALVSLDKKRKKKSPASVK
jgi:hypothetical protein